MADEARRFVDDEEIGVFVEDGEQFFQARKFCHRERRERREKIAAADVRPLMLIPRHAKKARFSPGID
jgi:hypothetical protein